MENATHKLIEKYLAGEMNPEEKALFESRWDSEPELATEVDLHMQAKYVGYAAAREDLKSSLKNRPLPEEPAGSVRKFPLWGYIAIAASVLLFAFLGFLFFQPGATLSGKEAFIAYAQIPAAGEVKSSQEMTPLRRANLAFNQKKYKDAVGQYTSILESDSVTKPNEVRFFLGLSYMQFDRPEEAQTQFRSIDPESVFWEEAEWFTAMVYLKDENIAEAKQVLARISQTPQHFYHEKATEVLSKLGH